MAFSRVSYTADGGTTNYAVTFPYLDQADVKVELDGVAETGWTWVNSSTIAFNTAPTSGVLIEVFRVTARDAREVNYTDGSLLDGDVLNLDSKQAFYMVLEALDDAMESLRWDPVAGAYDASSRKITNLAIPTADGDAATRGWTRSYGDAIVSDAQAIKDSLVNLKIAVSEVAEGTNSYGSYDASTGTLSLYLERGLQGPQGTQGVQGIRGQEGPQGVQGPEGVQGPQGLEGPQGGQGPEGPTGPQGPNGATGDKGPNGDKGALGDTPMGLAFGNMRIDTNTGDLLLDYYGSAASEDFAINSSGELIITV